MRSQWLRQAAAVSGLLASCIASAQQISSTASASDELEEVVVTGSRLNVSGFTTPTPVTVIGSDFMEQRAPVDLGELIKELPSLRNTWGAFTSTLSGTTLSAGQSYVDLRLGPTRTLVLVDGRRTAPSGGTGNFDINTIPTLLVDRVEVVTGGASAAYGSDAIAGVANFILKDKLDGFIGNVTAGGAEHGGNRIGSISAAWGGDLGSRAHALFGFEGSNNSGVGPWYEREYGRKEPGLVSYGAVGAATRNGRPAQAWVNGYELANNTPGGIITACRNAGGATVTCPGTLTNVAFNSDGTPYVMQKGTVVGTNMYGTTANYGNNPNSFFNVNAAYRRRLALGQVTFDLTDNTKLLLQLSGGRTQGGNIQNILQTSTVVSSTNPYIPAAVSTAMTNAGISSITVGRTNTDLGAYSGYQVNDYMRYLVDLNGKIFNDWEWDVYYQRSNSKVDGTFTGLRTADVNAAFGAVTVGGVAQCAAVAGATAGCVPFNIFGTGNASSAAYAYLTQYTQGFLLDLTQDMAEVSLRGEPLSTWAGPVAVATGADYRKDSQNQSLTRDSLRMPSGWTSGNFVAYKSHRSVQEAFVEANVPLLRDVPGAKSLDLNGAARYASYSDSGSYTTWKSGLTYDINQEYRLRLTRSRDMRAPTLSEQYSTSAQTTMQVQNPRTGTTDTPTFRRGVSLSLKGESADTTAIGFVVQPSWVPGLRMSVDYWNINITGAISTPATNLLVSGCVNQNIANYCRQLTFNSAGNLTAIVTEALNQNEVEMRGFDIEASYRIPNELLGGALTVRLLGTNIQQSTTRDPSGSVTEAAGTYQAPKWKATLSLHYANGPFATTAEVTGFSHIKYSSTVIGPDDPSYYSTVTSASCPGGTTAAPTQCAYYLVAPNSISQNLFPAAAYLNWTAQYDFSVKRFEKLQAFVGINNVLDKQPPDFAAVAFSNWEYYNMVGRSYKAGIRFSF